MNKKIWVTGAVVVVLAAGVWLSFADRSSGPQPQAPSQPQSPSSSQPAAFDGRNSTFVIDGKSVTLVSGVSEEAIPGSSAKIVTRYFGNEATGTLVGNDPEDEAFLVTQETGGSGVFYYVVVAIDASGGYKTTNAVFVGDRIAPQATHIQSDARELYVNYAERAPGEPMTAQPSQGATLALKVTPDGVLEGLMK